MGVSLLPVESLWARRLSWGQKGSRELSNRWHSWKRQSQVAYWTRNASNRCWMRYESDSLRILDGTFGNYNKMVFPRHTVSVNSLSLGVGGGCGGRG